MEFFTVSADFSVSCSLSRNSNSALPKEIWARLGSPEHLWHHIAVSSVLVHHFFPPKYSWKCRAVLQLSSDEFLPAPPGS